MSDTFLQYLTSFHAENIIFCNVLIVVVVKIHVMYNYILAQISTTSQFRSKMYSPNSSSVVISVCWLMIVNNSNTKLTDLCKHSLQFIWCTIENNIRLNMLKTELMKFIFLNTFCHYLELPSSTLCISVINEDYSF